MEIRSAGESGKRDAVEPTARQPKRTELRALFLGTHASMSVGDKLYGRGLFEALLDIEMEPQSSKGSRVCLLSLLESTLSFA